MDLSQSVKWGDIVEIYGKEKQVASEEKKENLTTLLDVPVPRSHRLRNLLRGSPTLVKPAIPSSHLIMMGKGKGKANGGKRKEQVHRNFATVNGIGPVYKFVRWIPGIYEGTTPTLQNAIASATTVSRYGCSFRLSDVADSAEFTSLFDQYRITHVEVHLVPRSNHTLTGATGTTACFVHTWLDFDNVGFTATNETDCYSYPTTEITHCHNTVIRRFKPYHCGDAGNVAGAAVVNSQTMLSTWLDVSAPTISYYGIKMALSATGVAADVIMAIYTKLHIECRNAR